MEIEGLNTPPYVFKEYPKWVLGKIVQTAAEEAALFHPLDHDRNGRKGGSQKRHQEPPK